MCVSKIMNKVTTNVGPTIYYKKHKKGHDDYNILRKLYIMQIKS